MQQCILAIYFLPDIADWNTVTPILQHWACQRRLRSIHWLHDAWIS